MLKNRDLGIFGLSLQKSTDLDEFDTVARQTPIQEPILPSSIYPVAKPQTNKMKLDSLLNQDLQNPFDSYKFQDPQFFDHKQKPKNTSTLHLTRIPKPPSPKKLQNQISIDCLYNSLKPKKVYN